MIMEVLREMERDKLLNRLVKVSTIEEILKSLARRTTLLVLILLVLNISFGFHVSKLGHWHFVCLGVPLIFFESALVKFYLFSRNSVLLRDLIGPFQKLTEVFRKVIRSDFHETDMDVECKVWEIVRFSEDLRYFVRSYVEALQENIATKQQLQAVYSEVHFAYKRFHEAYINFAKRLSVIAEAYDEQTGNHIERVGVLSAFIAHKLGLDDRMVELIKTFAPLHDIGKLLVPKHILNKPGRLTPEEFEEVKKHTLYGAQIIGDDPSFEVAKNIALYHHEKFDGSGYPFGLKGDEIPIEAQIVAVVDVYDALRSRRSYKKELSHEEAMVVLLGKDERTSFTHFNPRILSIFVKHSGEIKMLWDSVSFDQRQFFDQRDHDKSDTSKTS